MREGSRVVKSIPLWGRGGAIRAYATVSDDDYADLIQYRWYLGSRGYARRTWREGGVWHEEQMHRRIMKNPDLTVDHINRDRLDNRRENLREATTQEQSDNKSVYRSRTGIRGVRARNGRWAAQIRIDGTMRHLGTFDDPMEASSVVEAERARLGRS